MSISVVARGQVVDPPEPLSSDGGEVTVLVLRDVRPSGRASESQVAYEVYCRDPRLGRTVRDRVRVGDLLLVTGELWLERISGPLEDEISAARVRLDACTVAIVPITD